ncbi:MAG TPA: hypothetical protein VH640_09930 [Bryobacteraceae bacterium]|jgi:hypothetical protein
MRRQSKILIQLLTLGLLSSAICFADVITGSFTITGTAIVGATSITFNPDAKVATNTPSDDSNPTVGSAVTLKPLSEATTPIGETFPTLTDWLTTTSSVGNPGVGDVALDLTFLPTGINPSAPIGTPPCGISGGSVGNLCTPQIPALVSPGNPLGLSNFNLQNIAGPEFTASFTVIGTARDLDGSADHFTGSFTATLPGTYQTVLAEIASGKTPTFTYAAQFNFTAIPEPSYLSLLGIGGFLLVGIALYRRSQRA